MALYTIDDMRIETRLHSEKAPSILAGIWVCLTVLAVMAVWHLVMHMDIRYLVYGISIIIFIGLGNRI